MSSRAPSARRTSGDASSKVATVAGSASDRAPLYQQIYSYLCGQMESGELKIGDRLPSERSLAKTFGVSLMTARHALTQLEGERKVERRHAVGSFVQAPQIQFNKLEGLAQQLAPCGIKVESKVLSLRSIRAEIASRLGLPMQNSIQKLERLRLGGGEPIALEVSYFAVLESEKTRRADFVGPSLFTLLQRLCGDEPAYADEEIDATSADTTTSKLLRVPAGGPLLRSRQTLFSGSGRPLVFGISLYRSDRISIKVRRYR